MAHFTPDYEHLYMQEEFSDVTLVIQDERDATSAGAKRKRKTNVRTMPGHCLLLLGHSGYCKTKASQLTISLINAFGQLTRQQPYLARLQFVARHSAWHTPEHALVISTCCRFNNSHEQLNHCHFLEHC
jgi:hypothetical protein